MEEPPILVSPGEDDRTSGEIQADRFLGSLIFGIVLVTAMCLIVSGIFAQESRTLIFAGISLGIASTAGLIIWRIHVPEYFLFWSGIYGSGVGVAAIIIHALLSVLLGT